MVMIRFVTLSPKSPAWCKWEPEVYFKHSPKGISLFDPYAQGMLEIEPDQS